MEDYGIKEENTQKKAKTNNEISPVVKATLEREEKFLCAEAFHSIDTKGRDIPIEPCPYRTEFQRDRDRITHSKAFRRLMYKTQVFPYPGNDHFRTRLTHTIEVTQIARTIARAMALNEDLTEAAALGHDLGHTPFGHSGEHALNELCPKGFRHYAQSIRVVDILEPMNLTYEVKDAIYNHTGDMIASTLEGQILKFADRIAYLNHDIDDAKSAGLLKESDVPPELVDILGQTHGSRIGTMVSAVISAGVSGGISMNEPFASATKKLRQFMFERVYKNEIVLKETKKIKDMIGALYEHYVTNIDTLPSEFAANIEKDGKEVAVCDYIACMTDRFAASQFEELFLPKKWYSL